MKVYCSDCKFFRFGNRAVLGHWEDCRAEGEWKPNYHHRRTVWAVPASKNSSNDCTDYHARRMKRLGDWMRRHK